MFTSSQRNTELKDLPDFFTLADLSFVLGISKATAYRMADQSRIPCIRLGKRIILSKSHLKQWIDAEIGFEIQSTTTEDIILGLLPSFVVMFVCVDTQGVSGFPPFLFLGARWRSLKLFEIAMDAKWTPKKRGQGNTPPALYVRQDIHLIAVSCTGNHDHEQRHDHDRRNTPAAAQRGHGSHKANVQASGSQQAQSLEPMFRHRGTLVLKHGTVMLQSYPHTIPFPYVNVTIALLPCATCLHFTTSTATF